MVSFQPTMLGTRYMCSAGHYLASRAGFEILEAGGNAVDAGVAAAMSLVAPRTSTHPSVPNAFLIQRTSGSVSWRRSAHRSRLPRGDSRRSTPGAGEPEAAVEVAGQESFGVDTSSEFAPCLEAWIHGRDVFRVQA